jgi:hypothetical protein
MIAERLTKAINAGFAGTVAQASTAAQERRKAKEAQDTANAIRKRLEALQEPFKGLSKAQMAEVLQVASKLQEENAKAEGSGSKVVLGVGSSAESKLSIEDGQFVHCTLGLEQGPQLGCIGWIRL